MSELYVTARFMAKNDKVVELIKVLKELASETRKESGCLDYGYYQSADNPTVFTSFEIWTDSHSEVAHWETQHLKDALTKLSHLMDGEAEVTKYLNIA